MGRFPELTPVHREQPSPVPGAGDSFFVWLRYSSSRREGHICSAEAKMSLRNPIPIPMPIEVQHEPELVRTGAALKWMYILAVIAERVMEVSR